MARNDGKPEVQHYVPRVLLKNFAGGKKDGQLHVFDKHVGKRIPKATSIRKLCGERNFYVAKAGSAVVSIEEALSDLEGRVDPIFRNLIEQRSLAKLSTADRELLASFVVVQFLRVPRLQEARREIISSMLERSEKIAPNAKNLGELTVALEDNAIKLGTMEHIAGSTGALVPVISAYQWVLFKSTIQEPFWISDCPVVLHNDRTFGPYGNIGFAVPGIQVYLPIDSTLALGIWECSLTRDFAKRYEEARQALARLRTSYLLDIKVDRTRVSHLMTIPMPFDPVRSRKALQNQREASVGGLTQVGSLSC